MKIQSITSNHPSTSFNARITIGGNIGDISLRTISEWMSKAAKIGTDSDKIVLSFGASTEKKILSSFLGLIPLRRNVKSREIFALSNINGKQYDESIGYLYKKANFDEKTYIKQSVSAYLDKLGKNSD